MLGTPYKPGAARHARRRNSPPRKAPGTTRRSRAAQPLREENDASRLSPDDSGIQRRPHSLRPAARDLASPARGLAGRPGSGRPGRSPSPAPHRSGRAGLPHPAHQVKASLLAVDRVDNCAPGAPIDWSTRAHGRPRQPLRRQPPAPCNDRDAGCRSGMLLGKRRCLFARRRLQSRLVQFLDIGAVPEGNLIL